MRATLTLTLVASLAVVPAAAQSFRAENRLKVAAVDGGFEAIEGGDFSNRGLWCAGADYAFRVAGASNTDRLYVKAARAPAQTDPRRKAVTFTLDPTGLDPTPARFIGASLKTPGSNLAVAHAYQFCADSRLVRTR